MSSYPTAKLLLQWLARHYNGQVHLNIGFLYLNIFKVILSKINKYLK